MTRALVFALPGNEAFADRLAVAVNGERGHLTLHDLGAKRIGLAAPYLAYMRQDKRFYYGEAVTSHSFAALISRLADWLVARGVRSELGIA